MRLEDTKKLIRIYENQDQLGADQILSLMMVFMKEVQQETGNRVSEQELVSEPGNERVLLDALNALAIETANVMKKINPDEMEGFERYSKRICDKSEGMQNIANTIAEWKKLEESCQNVSQQIEEEEKKLRAAKQQLEKLKETKQQLEKQVAEAYMTEEDYQKEIDRLTEALDQVPSSENFLELKAKMNGIKAHYRVLSEIISNFLEDHNEETRLEMKFELSEARCNEHLQTIADRMDQLETYYSKMLNHLDELRRMKENEYAGK